MKKDFSQNFQLKEAANAANLSHHQTTKRCRVLSSGELFAGIKKEIFYD
jgi:hypothetical protein